MEINRHFLNSDGNSIGYFTLVKKNGEYWWQQQWFEINKHFGIKQNIIISDKRLDGALSLHENKFQGIAGSGCYYDIFSIPFLDGDL